jgi:peptidoglycan pentaglycine glycine transferase (the first glycine)
VAATLSEASNRLSASILEPREIGSEWDKAWDALAGQTESAGFMQSSAWAAFKRAEGYETIRYGLFDGEELFGGASLLIYSSAGSESIILCPEGPVLPWDDVERARDGLRSIIRAAQDIGKARGCVGLRIEPHLTPPRPSVLRNWTRGPVDLTPVETLILDLNLSDEELLACMHPKGRYNIRLAERHGVKIFRSTSMADIATFYPLFAATADRNGFFSEPYGFFLNLGEALFPSKQAELLLAEWQGEIIAGILVVVFGRRATYLYGGSSSESRHVMPNHALQWAAIRAGRERGCIEYDLYGYDPFGIPDHLYAGISRFKKQFDGRRTDWIGAWDYLFYDLLADRLMERLPALSNERRTA